GPHRRRHPRARSRRAVRAARAGDRAPPRRGAARRSRSQGRRRAARPRVLAPPAQRRPAQDRRPACYDTVMKRVMLAVWFAAGCNHGPSREQCKQLLDHLTDLEFKKAGAAASSDAMKAEIAKQKVTDAKGAEFIESCTQKMARSRVECALAANELE